MKEFASNPTSPDAPPRVSVIVPAHDEAAVIRRTLAALADGLPAGSEIVVVANGCADATADLARGVGGPVRVVETPVGGKVHALNLGDEVAGFFPRFYVDADVLLPGRAVGQMARRMRDQNLPAASTELRMDLSGCSWLVRSYYRYWTRLPYVRQGMIGVGMYAVGEAGRARFGRFPDVTNDDGFVRLLFEPHERPVIAGCASTVTPPRTLGGLVKIKTRSRRGNAELRRRFPELFGRQRRGKRYASSLLAAFRAGARPGDVVPYLIVTAAASIRGRLAGRTGSPGWERDDSSRAQSAATPAVGAGRLRRP